MPLTQMTLTTRLLLGLLIIACLLAFSLRNLGWAGTGSTLRLILDVAYVLAPLLVAVGLLVRQRFKYGTRSMLAATALVAVFLTASLLPLVSHRAKRTAGMRLAQVGAKGKTTLDWYNSSSIIQMIRPAESEHPTDEQTSPWLQPFVKYTSAIPPDKSVRTIWLRNDLQVKVLSDNWERLPFLQAIGVVSGISPAGLSDLKTLIPKFEYLELVHTVDIMPPKHWYESLSNIRTLWIWGEGVPGVPIPDESLMEVASLPTLEILMVHSYKFTDANAKLIAASPSIRTVLLRNTAATNDSEVILLSSPMVRTVHRD